MLAKQSQCLFGGALFGFSFTAARALTDDVAVQARLHGENALMGRTFFGNQNIFQFFSVLLLYDLLQCGFVVLGDLFAQQMLDVGNCESQDKGSCVFQAAVQIDRGNQSLEGIGGDRRTMSSVIIVLAFSEEQIVALIDFGGKFSQRLFADGKGAELGKVSFGEIRMILEQIGADNQG